MQRTKRTRRTVILGAAVIAGSGLIVAGCGSSSSSTTGASSTGSGSSFAAPTYNTWCTASKLCTYISKGSGAGITDFTNGVVTWGATDSPLTPSELATLASTRGGVTPIYFPTYLGAIGVPAHVTGAPNIQFSGTTLADIFDGTITKWNAPEIAADNPGVTLPNASITVCVRADSSGTSSNFSGYLAVESATFVKKVGKASKQPPWTAPHVIASPKNPGVLQCVKDNANAVGYADYADVLTAGDQSLLAKVKAPNGTYVAPSVASTTAAGTTATVSQPINPTALQKSLLNSSGTGAYPITITTFVLAYSNYQQAGMSKSLAGTKSFLNYAYGSTAQGALNAIGNAPLPASILSAAKTQLGSLH